MWQTPCSGGHLQQALPRLHHIRAQRTALKRPSSSEQCMQPYDTDTGLILSSRAGKTGPLLCISPLKSIKEAFKR